MLNVSPGIIREPAEKGCLKNQIPAEAHQSFSQFHVEVFAQERNIALNLSSHSGRRILIVGDDRQVADFLTVFSPLSHKHWKPTLRTTDLTLAAKPRNSTPT